MAVRKWLLPMVLAAMTAAASCRNPVIIARKKLAGYEICSALHEGLAVVLASKTRKLGFADRDGNVAIAARFYAAYPFSEGLAAVQTNWSAGFGYIDRTGKLAIPPSFDGAFAFSEGLAAVKLNGKYGYIGKTGAMAIPATFDWAEGFSEGLAKVVVEGMAGFVDKTGAMAVSPVYWKAGQFRGGLASACTRDRCGFVNQNGEVAIPFRFDDARDFSSGFAPVREGAKWGYIDTGGNWLVTPRFEEAHEFREGAALVGKLERDPPDRGYGGYSGETTVYGFLDPRGGFLIPPSIPRAGSFSDGLSRIQVPAGGLCSDCYDVRYLAKDGRLLPRYGFGGDFHGGTAVVRGGAGGNAGYLIDRDGDALIEFDAARFDSLERRAARTHRIRFGYLDRNGKTAIPFAFHEAEPFSEGVALVRGPGKGRAYRLQFIDRRGELRLEIPAAASRAQSFSGGLALISYHEKGRTRFVYVNRQGEARIEGEWDEAHPFADGLAAVKTGREAGANDWGYIDASGKTAIAPAYRSAGAFSGGLAPVTYVEDTYLRSGWIDRDGKMRVPSFYEPVNGPPGPRDLVPVWTPEGFAYAARDGRIAIRDRRIAMGNPFYEGLAAVFDGSRWGYIDTAGKTAIPARFVEAARFSEGVAAVRDEAGRRGYIDRAGGWAVAPAFFEEARDFSDGLALVKVNGLFGYIDRKGGFRIRPAFPRAQPFREGLAVVGRE